jgi:hypothetical protein
MARVRELRFLRLHPFGHVHGGYGVVEENQVMFVNAALWVAWAISTTRR